MEDMTIGMCLDYIDEFIDQRDPKKSKKADAREATAEDIANF